MKSKSKKPKLKKYPLGGASPYGPTKTHPNALPTNPTLDDYNKRISGIGQMNVTTPGGVPGDIAAYTHDSIAVPMQGMQGQLNTALLKKYNYNDLSQIHDKDALTPYEAEQATHNQYNKFNQLSQAYDSYRDKTNLDARISPTPSSPSFGDYAKPTLPLYDSTQVAKFNSYNKHKYGGVQKFGSGGSNVVNDIGSFAWDALAGTVGGFTGGATDQLFDAGYQSLASSAGYDPTNPDDVKKMNEAQTWGGVGQTAGGVISSIYGGGSGTKEIGAGLGKAAGNLAVSNGADQSTASLLSSVGSFAGSQAGQYANNNGMQGAGVANRKDPVASAAVQKQQGQFPMGGTQPCYGCGGEMYPNGGEANAEVEKQEVMRMPDGGTTQVDGSSHENGGVPVNIPNGTQIYSDRLKMPGTKKTFAKLAAQYKTDKQDKVLADDSANKTAKDTAKLIVDTKQRKLTEIFNTQEQLKQDKVLAYANKMGLDTNEFAKGGRFMGINPAHKGYCTPMSKPTCTGHRRALALTLKKHHGFHANGGTQFNPDGTYKSGITDQQYADMVDQDIANGFPTSKPQIDQDLLASGISAGLQSMGNITDLIATNGGKNYDKVNLGHLNPRLIDDSAAINDANREMTASRGALLANVGGNAGAYLSNLNQLRAGNLQNIAAIRNNTQNTNQQILSRNDEANLNLKNQSNDLTAQNKARSEDIARVALRGLGSNAVNAYKDYKAGAMDKNTASMISSMFANYKLDMNNENHWKWVYNQLQKK